MDSRIVNLGDRSAQARIPMAVTAIRYSLDHPLGTGRYMPEMSHLPAGLGYTDDRAHSYLNAA